MMNLNNNTAATTTTVVTVLVNCINAITKLSDAVFRNSFEAGFSLEERTGTNLFFTKEFISALIEKNRIKIDVVMPKADEEIKKFEKVIKASPEKFLCMIDELTTLLNALNSFKASQPLIEDYLRS